MKMARCFVGYWTNDLLDKTKPYIPIGVVLRNQDNVEVRIIDKNILPEAYMPRSELGKSIFSDLENIFKTTENYSNNPTNLYFKEIKTDPIGKDLSEQIDNLFIETIMPLYMPLYNNSYKVNF